MTALISKVNAEYYYYDLGGGYSQPAHIEIGKDILMLLQQGKQQQADEYILKNTIFNKS